MQSARVSVDVERQKIVYTYICLDSLKEIKDKHFDIRNKPFFLHIDRYKEVRNTSM